MSEHGRGRSAVDGPRWRDLLCGRWAISVQATAIVVVAGVPFSSVTGIDGAGLSGPGIVAANIAGSAGLVGVLTVASFTVLRSRRRRLAPLLAVVSVWMVAGAVRRLAALAVAHAMGGAVTLDVFTLLAFSGATATALGVLACVFALHDAYRRCVDETVDAQALLADPRSQSLLDVQSRRRALVAAVEDVLHPEFSRLVVSLQQLQGEPSRAQLLVLADRVDSQSRDMVRMVSQRIVESDADRHDAFGRPSEVRHPFRWSALLSIRVSVVLTLLLKAVFGGVWTLGVRGLAGLPQFAVALAVGAVVLVVGSLAWRLLAPVMGASVVIVTYLTYVLAQALGVAAMPLAPGYTGVSGTLSFAIAAVTGLFVGVFASLIDEGMQGLRTLTGVRDTLVEQSREASLARAAEIATLERQIAQMLHGPVQGRLATVAVALRLSAEQGSDAFAQVAPTCERLLEQAGDDIASIAGPMTPSTASLTEQLDAVAGQWRGFLTMTYDLSARPSSLDGDHESLALLVATVGEAVTNASRHGHARTVHVVVEPMAGHAGGAGLRVVVADDGRPPAADVTPGGGLQDIARRGGRWRLRPSGLGGCELTVELPRA